MGLTYRLTITIPLLFHYYRSRSGSKFCLYRDRDRDRDSISIPIGIGSGSGLGDIMTLKISRPKFQDLQLKYLQNITSLREYPRIRWQKSIEPQLWLIEQFNLYLYNLFSLYIMENNWILSSWFSFYLYFCRFIKLSYNPDPEKIQGISFGTGIGTAILSGSFGTGIGIGIPNDPCITILFHYLKREFSL